MTMHENINNLSNFIQSLIANNPFAQSLSAHDITELRKHGYMVNDNSVEPTFSAETYEDIAFSIYMDHFCEHQFSLYRKNDYNADSLPTPKQVQDDFKNIYSTLTNNWYKFSSNSDAYTQFVLEASMLIFQEIYNHYPVLCTKLLPTVAFVIADNYHALAEKIFAKGTRCISKKISKDKIHNLIQYFEKCFFYASPNLYIYSLLNCKSTNFTKDSQEEGRRIQNRILSYFEKKYLSLEEETDDAIACCIDTTEIDPFFTDLENYIAKIYSQELKKKMEQRKKSNFAETSIPLGENFLSFITLLKRINEEKNSTANFLDYCDLPTSLYHFNKITGWIELLLTYQADHINNQSYAYLYQKSMNLATINAIIDNRIDVDREDLHTAEFSSLLDDVTTLGEEIRSNNLFNQWINSATTEEIKDFVSHVQFLYERIKSQLTDSLSLTNWFKKSQFAEMLLPFFFLENS